MPSTEKISDTKELMRRLQSDPAQFLDRMRAGEPYAEQGLTLKAYLTRLCAEKEMPISRLIEKSLLSRAFVYQILDGSRQPGRDVLLRMALVLRLDVEESQRLLALAGRGALYPKVRRDAAILCSLQLRVGLMEANEYLTEIGENALL